MDHLVYPHHQKKLDPIGNFCRQLQQSRNQPSVKVRSTRFEKFLDILITFAENANECDPGKVCKVFEKFKISLKWTTPRTNLQKLIEMIINMLDGKGIGLEVDFCRLAYALVKLKDDPLDYWDILWKKFDTNFVTWEVKSQLTIRNAFA